MTKRMRAENFRTGKDDITECIVPMLRNAAEEVMAFSPKNAKATLYWLAADRIEALEKELAAEKAAHMKGYSV